MPNTETEEAPTGLRAFAYLRVSSEGQKTDYSEDGLSIDAQREGVKDKAAQLGAEIVGEFSDPGKSAFTELNKRTGFLAMLEELTERNNDPATRVDFVIVWALSRWSRNTVDHWQTRQTVRQAGARLISITEPMAGEDSAAAFLYESMIATHNQFQSMQTSENVKRGMHQKASVGGTIGPAPLGYLNTVDVMADGRRVPIVIVDPERGHFVTLAFQLYSSGQYSLSQLANELERLGLRSRPNKRWPTSTPLGTSVLQRLLRNRYYAGHIVYKRDSPEEAIFKGRHEPLTDQETFERVQSLLDEKRVAGERPQIRKHYLRGSVFCDECGSRLGYGLSTGKNGQRYAYFFCLGRIKRNGCDQRANIRPQLIEEAIADFYGREPIAMTPERILRSKEAVRALAEVSQEALRRIQDAKTSLITKLQAQQRRLIRMYAEEGDDVSPDAFRDERTRIQAEIDAAEQSLAETRERLVIEVEQIEQALELVDDIQAVYLAADDETRRSYNQAFFNKLRIRAEWDYDTWRMHVEVTGVELTEPYEVLLTDDLVDGIENELAQVEQANAPERADSAGALTTTDVSYFVKMAEREGFEPSVEITPNTRFPVVPVQPLRHLSRGGSEATRSGAVLVPTRASCSRAAHRCAPPDQDRRSRSPGSRTRSGGVTTT
jgi:site-specific DNA recombinase